MKNRFLAFFEKIELPAFLRTIWRYVASRYPALVMPLVLVAAVDALSRSNASAMLDWMWNHPNERELNVLIAAGIIWVAAALFGRTRIAFVSAFGVCGVLAFLSGMKTNATGAPLFLWDIVLPHGSRDIVRPLNPSIRTELIVIAAVTMIVLAVLLRYVRAFRTKWRPVERLVFGLIGALLLWSAYADVPLPLKAYEQIYTIGWDQAENYEWNGYLLSTFMAAQLTNNPKPDGYSADKIAEIAAQTPRQKAASEGPKPNIIVLLSESFFDPTKLPGVEFSEDPIPFFRSLERDYTSGAMLSPEYGGSTANVEFEVLSGNSMRFLPEHSIAYIEYMGRETDSLASILRRQGYATSAFNPFYEWFFNSRNVYRNFGFSKYVSSEYFDPIYHGPWLADKQVMERVIQTTEDSPGPDFIFANTMENHGGYKDKFGYNPIQVRGQMSDESRNILENYATGIRGFDEAFRLLIDHYAKSPEPTIILCFGDHQPALGSDYSVLRDLHYITGENDPDFLLKTHQTPFVIWSNLPNAPKEQMDTSPSFLGPYLLHLAGREGTIYTDYLYELSKKIRVIPPIKDWPAWGIHAEDLQDYRLLEYDNLFGNRYAWKGIGPIADSGYRMGWDPAISSVTLKDGQLKVTGDHFASGCTIWLDGRKLSTSWLNDHEMTAVSPRMALDGAAHKVQVKLVDDKRSIIAESDPFSFASNP